MLERKNNSLKLGFFIILGLVFFVVTIYVIGSKRNLFKQTIKIVAIFNDVKGLRVGNNVRYTGIDVGNVNEIVILPEAKVRVEMSLDKDVQPFIKKNSLATIASDGLMGNKIVIITPGTPDQPSVERWDEIGTIEPIEIDDILKEIKISSERIAIVSQNIVDITNTIKEGKGVFGKIFTDKSLTNNLDKAARNVTEMSVNLYEIADKINSGEGIFGLMLTDTLLSKSIRETGDNLVTISEDFSEITDKVNQGKGIFGRILADTTLTSNLYLASKSINETSINLQEVSENLISVTSQIHSGKGIVTRLLTDSLLADSIETMIYNLNTGIIEVTEASEALQKSGLVKMFSKDKKEKNK